MSMQTRHKYILLTYSFIYYAIYNVHFRLGSTEHNGHTFFCLHLWIPFRAEWKVQKWHECGIFDMIAHRYWKYPSWVINWNSFDMRFSLAANGLWFILPGIHDLIHLEMFNSTTKCEYSKVQSLFSIPYWKFIKLIWSFRLELEFLAKQLCPFPKLSIFNRLYVAAQMWSHGVYTK